ncbi:MAG TPA: hypothetical protein VMV17_02465 [Streptosporangiaceae bacterium]|nr:hypothetical protein [Streptosporangiaceae bacterium]
MSFYPAVPLAVTLSAGEDAAAGLLGRAGMVAVRLEVLASPARAGLGKDGRSALVVAGAGKIRTGDLVVFCKPVAVAAAVVRRDGRVQAAGHPSDHVRLGLAEERLDALCGRPGVIDQAARDLTLKGKIRGDRRRVMTPALAIRFVLLMTLMPAGYAEVLAALFGDLAGVPWQRPWALPTATVASAWRDAAGPEPLEWLRDMLLAGIDTEHQDRDYRAVTVGDLDVYSADGCLTRVPDTPANRDAFGSAGTSDDSSPYPQLREVRFGNASTRATVAVTSGPSGAAAGGGREKGEAEQVLLDRALEIYPRLFTDRRIWVLDRNFPGVPRIRRMLSTGTHVLIRLKSDIPLRREGAFLPDGSYLAELSGGGETLTIRVIEYTITVDGSDAPEMFCLITDLHDHASYPVEVLARAYHWRWIGSETALKEAKSAISGAGPSTGAMLRSGSPALIAQEHAAWIISAELARAAARAAAAIAVPARKGPRASQPVHPREISFTAARRAIIATTRAGAATASLPAALTTANHARALTGLARCRVQADRDRHRDRKTKARPGFPAGGPRLPTRTAPARITVCGPITPQAAPARTGTRYATAA